MRYGIGMDDIIPCGDVPKSPSWDENVFSGSQVSINGGAALQVGALSIDGGDASLLCPDYVFSGGRAGD